MALTNDKINTITELAVNQSVNQDIFDGEKVYQLNGRYLCASDSDFIGVIKNGNRINIPCPGHFVLEHDSEIVIPKEKFLQLLRIDNYKRFDFTQVFF
jgi:hypothetical protein